MQLHGLNICGSLTAGRQIWKIFKFAKNWPVPRAMYTGNPYWPLFYIYSTYTTRVLSVGMYVLVLIADLLQKKCNYFVHQFHKLISIQCYFYIVRFFELKKYQSPAFCDLGVGIYVVAHTNYGINANRHKHPHRWQRGLIPQFCGIPTLKKATPPPPLPNTRHARGKHAYCEFALYGPQI